MQEGFMRKHTRVWVILGVAVLATSCVTMTIESAKADLQGTAIDGLYVVLDMGSETDYFNKAVKAELEAALQETGITVTVRLLSGLEVDYGFIDKEMEQSGINYLLIVQLTQLTGVTGGWGMETLTGGDYDLSIYDTLNERRIWRAKLDYHGGNYGMMSMAFSEGQAEDFADRIVGALKKDAILLEITPTE
jgi:hypothetical protein